MEATNTQLLFFGHIKNMLPPYSSLVNEVAERLNISNDSAYRRIRGEKPISLEELQILCSHYKISLDQFLHLQSDAFIFSGKINTESETPFEDFVNEMLKTLQFFNSFKRRHMYFLMKDLPSFVHFQVPELAIFKFYSWTKTILHNNNLKGIKFSFDDDQFYSMDSCKKIIEVYNNIPSTEIWNLESIISTLNQINFYLQSGAFKNNKDVYLLYDKVEELINHIEREAELGLKFNIGTAPGIGSGEYRLFVNEFVLGDNSVFLELDDTRITFLNHSILNFIGTKDERFNSAMYTSINNLIKKSTMVSTNGEKERVIFFNRLRDKINQYREMLK